MHKPRLVRVSTVPLSLKMFCTELLDELRDTYDVLAVSSPGPELDDLAARGIPVHSLPIQRAISPLSDLRALVRLTRLLRRQRPDIVHSLTPKAGLLCMMAAWMARVPVRVHSFTGLVFPTATGLKRLILKTTDRITCACATHVLPEGHGVKADLEHAHITSKPMRVLGNGNLRGIDPVYYDRTPEVMGRAAALARDWGIGADSFTFVFIGRIVRDKGIWELAQAFSRLVSAHPHVHLVLAGVDEPAEDPLAPDTIRLLKATPNIHRTDAWVDDTRPYYAMADALVFPSYREGFPNVVLEAGAMGLPSIVTDINGSREIIREGVNGDIVPAHDAEALYRAMETHVTDRAYSRRLAQQARPMVIDRYEASYVRRCLKDFYAEALNRR